MLILGDVTGEGGGRAALRWAGARVAALVGKYVLDAPCSMSVDGKSSGRLDENGKFLDGSPVGGGCSCTFKGRFRVEAARVKLRGNTAGTLQLSKGVS